MRPRAKRLVWVAPFAIAGVLVFAFVGGLIVMRLWNWLLPPLFGWPEIGFWQALGLLALCRILFGGFGGRGCGPRSRMRRRMEERWENMTPEEREQFRQRVRARWDSGSSNAEGQWR